MKIKRYSIKEGTTIEDIKAAGGREGGTWINEDSKLFISKSFEYKFEHGGIFEFSIAIAFKDDINDWNDFDNVLVLDEDFCQPYTPFYGENFEKDVKDFPCLRYCIKKYNEFMDSLSFLEELKYENEYF